VLETTHGEIEIELFARECPLATRNFVLLCLDGYYDRCEFHRVINGFMVQTGDRTNTGSEGKTLVFGNDRESARKKYKDELHSRIKFNKRGQVACANEGRRDSNSSQFFITLERCAHLDRKHTIFGKVVGQTFYNVQRIGEVECVGEKPVKPEPRILKAVVVWNPFEDIVREHMKREEDRVKQAKINADNEEAMAKMKKKLNNKKEKNLGLLSFADDEEVADDEEEEEKKTRKKIKISSAHDAVDTLDVENKLASAAADNDEYAIVLKQTEEETEKNVMKSKDLEHKMREKMREKREKLKENNNDDDIKNGGLAKLASEMNGKISDAEVKQIEKATKARLKEEKIKRKIEREQHKKDKLKKLGLGKALVTKDDAALMSSHEVKRAEAKLRNRRVVDREKDTLAKLRKFNDKLNASTTTTHETNAVVPEADEQKAARDGFVGVSKFVPEGLYYMEDLDEDGNEYETKDDEDTANDWRKHSLKFSKDPAQSNANAYLANADDYQVIDPRKPMTGEIGYEQVKQKQHSKSSR
jgi:peptidyl-prolyl cis-trans isomerase SDCCAG10